MQLELNEEEQRLVKRLLDSRIRDLHPTIRRSRVSHCTDELKRDLACLAQLQRRFEAAACTNP